MNTPVAESAEGTAVNTPPLENTLIAPTLDAAIEPGKNVVWCASFQAAWKRLQNDVVKGPVRLNGAEALVEALNNAPDPAEDIPEESLYAAAGLTQDGIVERVILEMAERFPEKEEPDIRGAVGFLAYAYLTASLEFPDPYLQNDEPLLFTDSNGRRTDISSFGLREKDKNAYWELRMQPRLLYAAENVDGVHEFALDLWWRSPSVQLVLARIEPEESLAATVARVMSWSNELRFGPLSTDVVVLVPDMDWRLGHNYSEIEGKSFTNPGIDLPAIDVVRQDIKFNLNRSGAQLSSEAMMMSLGVSKPENFIFDRPFLLYMKMRQVERPFLALWIDNAELLKSFSAEEALETHSISETVWLQVQEIIDGVESIIGSDARPELQSTEAYQVYKGLCGAARHDYENDQLYKDLLDDLSYYAEQVIKIHRDRQHLSAQNVPAAEPPVPGPKRTTPTVNEEAQSEGSVFGRLLHRLRGG